MPDLTRNSLASQTKEACAGQDACAEALDWLTSLGSVDTLEAVRVVPDISWCVWAILKIGPSMDRNLQTTFVDKLVDPKSKLDPAVAFRLWVDATFLAGNNRAKLEAVFKGKLPWTERQL